MAGTYFAFSTQDLRRNLGAAKNRLTREQIMGKAMRNESLSAEIMLVVSDAQVLEEMESLIRVLPEKP